MGKVVTFGEIMMRLNPEEYLRFVQADKFEVSYGGGEANVAVSMANYGFEASFVTKVPDHELGQSVVNYLRRYGVNTGNIVRGGPRLGVYYVEKGASQRASKVIYDRANSSIALAKREEFHWDEILEGAHCFYFTGITPALGGELPRICRDACETARAKGITIFCDLNYRKKLWATEQAGTVMAGLMPYVDVCIGNEEDAADVFGIKAAGTDIQGGKLNYDGYVSVARQLRERFGFKKVAITLRGSISASENDWAGMVYDGTEAFFSTTYRIQIVDRVGGGDAFGGALAFALMSGYDGQKAIDFAAAASCLKHTVHFDFNMMTVEEVASLAAGNASGRVQR